MRSILKRKSLLAVDLSLPMRLRGHFKGLSKGASKFGQWVAPWVPFLRVLQKSHGGKQAKSIHDPQMSSWNVFPHWFPRLQICEIKRHPLLRCTDDGAERAVQWPSCSFHLEIAMQAIHLHLSHTAWEKNPPHGTKFCGYQVSQCEVGRGSGIVKKIHPKWVRNIESPHTHQLVQDFTHQNCTPWFCWGSHCAPSFASSSPRRYLRLQPASKFGPNGIFQVQKKGWMWSLANQKGSKLKPFGLNKIENSWCFISNFV